MTEDQKQQQRFKNAANRQRAPHTSVLLSNIKQQGHLSVHLQCTALVHLDWEGTVVLWHNCVTARRPWQKIQAFACSPHISVHRHEFGLTVHSTLAIGVNVNVNGCLSLCVSPVINGVHPGHVIYLPVTSGIQRSLIYGGSYFPKITRDR